MEKGILHLHITVIVIFLLSLGTKTFLLLANNLILLEKIRAKTKIIEMIIGTLILLTGGYLLYITKNNQTYMIVKIILVLAAIPLGIIGLKKNSKLLATLSVVIFIYVFALAQTRDLTLHIGDEAPTANVDNTPDSSTIPDLSSNSIIDKNEETSLENSKAIYNKLCVQCHGPSGNLGAAGAKDLGASVLTDEQKENIIANGKGLMAPFKHSLTEQEIKAMVQYVNTFKK